MHLAVISVSNAMEKIYLRAVEGIVPGRLSRKVGSAEFPHPAAKNRTLVFHGRMGTFCPAFWKFCPAFFLLRPSQRRVGDNPPYHLTAAVLIAIFLLGFLLSTSSALAATNAGGPTPNRVSGRTNSLSSLPSARPKTNAVATSKGAVGKTTALDRVKAQFTTAFQNLRSSRAFYPVVGGVTVCLVLAIVFLSRFFKSKAEQQGESGSLALGSPSVASRPVHKESKVYYCNVLQIGSEAQHLWRFEAQNGGFTLNRQATALSGDLLPLNLVRKDWRTLFQRKLNVAWLPPEHVFLRVAHFPRSDFNETLAMVELQLEKLSPIPVTQIVWTIHVLPHSQDNLQTIVVMIVARDVVEELLGRLEGQGYMADRLELPLLDQLQATPITEDGAWIYPQARESGNTALVAWWSEGNLQNLDLVSFSGTPEPASLKEQLSQMAWAGEMEGWLKTPPRWHLVADSSTAALWEPALREGLEQTIQISAPLPPVHLAALTATRAAHSDPRANLLPIEFSTRYHQQFVDRLWMRGLLAVATIYLLGVAIYGVALGFAIFRTRGVESKVAELGGAYTNAVQLKARYQVLKDRQELKFAALECWNLTARYLPESATLDTMNFIEGKKLALTGKAPADLRKEIIDFEGELRRATGTNGDLIFDPTKGEHWSFQVQGTDVRWNFSLELKRSEVE